MILTVSLNKAHVDIILSEQRRKKPCLFRLNSMNPPNSNEISSELHSIRKEKCAGYNITRVRMSGERIKTAQSCKLYTKQILSHGWHLPVKHKYKTAQNFYSFVCEQSNHPNGCHFRLTASVNDLLSCSFAASSCFSTHSMSAVGRP